MVIALVCAVLSIIGLILVFSVAVNNSRNIDGEIVNATVYSGCGCQCFEVTAKFDKERVLIFAKNAAITLRDNLVISKNSFIDMVLVDEHISDPTKVRVIEPRHKAYLDINVQDKECAN